MYKILPALYLPLTNKTFDTLGNDSIKKCNKIISIKNGSAAGIVSHFESDVLVRDEGVIYVSCIHICGY
jgi:hypothetical protein